MLITTIIISGIAVGVFLLSLMLSKKQKLAADKFLIAYLSFFIVSQVYFYLEAQGRFQLTSWMLLGRGIYLLGGPLFFYYVYTLTTSKRISRLLYGLTLLPFIAYVVHFFYYYWVGFNGENVHVENGLLYINDRPSVSWTFFVVVLVINDPFYLMWFYRLLKAYRQRTVQSVSNLERINLNWLSVIFYLWAISVVILLPILVFSVGQSWFTSEWISVTIQVDYLLFIFLLGFYGFRQSAVFSISFPEAVEFKDERKSAMYERSGLTTEQAEIYRQRLLELMENKKPYLEGSLTVQQLALQLDMAPNHLSQVINQREGKNFFDFINQYRVEEVKRKMADGGNKKLTLLALALDSGFNSKTSFNGAFKKNTGKTPSHYYKSQGSPEE